MDLLERYLQAVKFWLPGSQKHDIIAELSEDLRSHIEDKETELGRPVTDAEVEAILRHVGRPVLVANRYLPQRYLIGPLWFPIYEFVLKIVVALSVVPRIMMWVSLLAFDPAYRDARAGAGWLDALGAAWSGAWVGALTAVGIVTIVFAALERSQARSALMENWDPGKLPAVRNPNLISRGASTLEIVANSVFCSWWIAAMWSPVILDRPEAQVTLSSAWRTFFLGFLILALVNIAAAGINLLRPYWTQTRAVGRLVSNLTGSALYAGLCQSSIVSNISVAGVSAARTLEITNMINRVMSQAFPFVLVVALVILAVDIRRVVRARAIDSRSSEGMVHAIPPAG